MPVRYYRLQLRSSTDSFKRLQKGIGWPEGDLQRLIVRNVNSRKECKKESSGLWAAQEPNEAPHGIYTQIETRLNCVQKQSWQKQF